MVRTSTDRDPSDEKTQMTGRSKWQEDPSDKKTYIARRLKWQEDSNDKKTQLTRVSKWQEDPSEKKTQMTRRPNDKITQVEKNTWQEECVAKRLTDIMLTDRMLTDGHPLICWMSILKNILKSFSLSNREDNNTSTNTKYPSIRTKYLLRKSSIRGIQKE